MKGFTSMIYEVMTPKDGAPRGTVQVIQRPGWHVVCNVPIRKNGPDAEGVAKAIIAGLQILHEQGYFDESPRT